jgi:hypothetical protein
MQTLKQLKANGSSSDADRSQEFLPNHWDDSLMEERL